MKLMITVKKRKISFISLLLIILSYICGCSKSVDNNTVITPTKGAETNLSVMPTNGAKTNISVTPAVEAEYRYNSSIKAEKKLVWVCDAMVVQDVDKEVFDEFNRILVNKYHCNFTVDLVGMASSNLDAYQAMLRKMKNKGEQADILYTGAGNETKDTYPQAVQDNLLMPLTDKLKNTKYGRTLYETFDKKFWEGMKYNGTIYGVGPLAEAAGGRCFILSNNEYYKGDFDTGKITFGDLGRILDKMEKNKEIPDTILPLAIDSSTLCTFEGYIQAECGYDGIYYKKEKGKWRFVNGADEEKIQQIWKNIKKYEDINNCVFGDVNEKLRKGEYCIAICPLTLEQMNDGKVSLLDSGTTDVTELNSMEGYIIALKSGITGIASWSKNSKEALQFLSLLESKRDLSNLLEYGIKGKHYTMINNRPKEIDSKLELPGYLTPINTMLTYPQGLEPVNKEKIYKQRNSQAILSPQAIYQLDYGKYRKQLKDIGDIYAGFNGLWNGQYDNVDETIQALQKKVKDAGVDELINNLNKLLPE